MNGASDLWYVQLADGDVHRVTLDQLDEGFQAGHIDGDTMVLAAGAAKWTKLGLLAGIDEVSAPARAPSPIDASVRVVATPIASAAPAPPSYPVPLVDSPVVPAEPEFPSSAVTLLESNRPVSVDLSDLALQAGLPPRRSGKRWLIALVGLAMVGGAGVTAIKRPGLIRASVSHVGHSAIAAKSWAAGAIGPRRLAATEDPAPTITAPTVAPVLTPSAVATTSATTASTPTAPTPETAADPHLSAPPSGQAKARPHDGEKAPPGRTKPRKAHGATPSAAPSPGHAAFTTGGSKFDPLSSSIQ
jgi:hypothetical protein